MNSGQPPAQSPNPHWKVQVKGLAENWINMTKTF